MESLSHVWAGRQGYQRVGQLLLKRNKKSIERSIDFYQKGSYGSGNRKSGGQKASRNP
jgi:hypothetical protein